MVALALAVVTTVWLLSLPPELGRARGSNLLQLAAAAFAALAAVARARSLSGRPQLHLRYVAAAATAWAAGQLYWTIAEWAGNGPPPFPSVADIGFLSAYPLLLAGLLKGQPPSYRPGFLRASLDWLTVGCSLAFVSWAAGLGPLVDQIEPTGGSVLAVAYPVADILVVTVLVVGMVRCGGCRRAAAWRMAAGIAAVAVADSAFAYLTSDGAYSTGIAVDAGWILGWGLVGWGALVTGAGDEISPTAGRSAGERLAVWLPAIALLGVASTAVAEQLSGHPFGDDAVLFGLGVTTFLVNVGRSAAAHAEAAALNRSLTARAAAFAADVTRYDEALDAAGAGTWDWDYRSGRVLWSPTFARMHRLPEASTMGTIVDLLALIHPDDKQRVVTAITTAIEAGERYDVDYRLVGTPSETWIRSQGRPTADSAGAVDGVAGLVIDVTARRAMTRRLEARIEQARALAELGHRALAAPNTPAFLDDAVATAARGLSIELAKVLRFDVSTGLLHLDAGVGWRPGAVGSATVAPDERSQAGYTLLADAPVVVQDLRTETRFSTPQLLLDHGVRSGMSTVIRTEAGAWGVLGAHTSEARAFDQEDAYFLATIANAIGAVLDRIASHERVSRLTLHDELTDLPNRALLTDRAQVAVAEARRTGRYATLLHVGIDRFRLVNESFGQAAGDAALLEVGRRLRDVARPGDTVARYGGDEFVIVGISERPGDAASLAEQVLAALSMPLAIGEPPEDVFLTVSIGVAFVNGQGSAEGLLRDGAAAAARASAKGGGRFEIYDERLRHHAVTRLRDERELREALAARQLLPYYQPVVRIADGAVVGVEALARWHHPYRGVLLPEAFIGTAEETGLVVPLGEQILAAALEDAAGWPIPETYPFTLAVNVSPLQLADRRIVDAVVRALATTAFEPERLVLEIVETALSDAESAGRTLRELKGLGPMRIYIDDFGTGHSSLSRLHSWRVDGLKIDRRFVHALGNGNGEHAIAATIIDLGRAMGLRVVAEGVETPEQLAILRDLGCELAQGWLFAPALPAEETAHLLSVAPTAYAHVVNER